ncbi:MAG: arylsulfatase [Clostridia bacterium]
MNKKPNIVWVLTDDQGYGDLGCTGNNQIKTENIDNFYANSIRMTDYHVGPTCAPTRSTLMTGHYANSTGVWHTVGGRSLLREDEWTIANALSENGYSTGIFGKWHLGDSEPYAPYCRGFQKSITHGGGGISQTPDFWGNDYFDDTYSVNGVNKKFDGYCTDVFFEEGMKFIEENKEQPFFCFIPTNAPHSPYNVPKKYYDLYKDNLNIPHEERKRFYGMISNIDENFGKLISHIKNLGLYDNTIIIFMTDNGTSCGAGMNHLGFVRNGFNAGLRGSKCSEYDGGHRTPFFLKFNNMNMNGGKDVSEITGSIDLMPTLLDLCNIDYGNHNFHGKSIVPLLNGEKVEKRYIVTDSQRLTYPQKWRKSSVMSTDWRLVNGCELYSTKDREQRFDIAGRHPDVVKTMREEYNKWWKLVSVKFDEEIRQHVSSKELTLVIHDLRSMIDKSFSNTEDVRQGSKTTGHYELFVDEDGLYEIDVRRWPKSIDLEICAGIDKENNDIFFEKDLIQEKEHGKYCGGKALDIVRCELTIGEHILSSEVKKSDKSANFTVKLTKGAYHLKMYLVDKNEDYYFAYYAYINKVK